jgi:hypothetical protein
LNGPWLELAAADKAALQITMGSAGTLNGTWALQVALGDTQVGATAPLGTPTTLEGSSFAVVNGLIAGEASLVANISVAPFSWIRWVWTRTSGTGTLTESLLAVKGE